MMIFRAGETAGDGELAGTIVSIPRGARASSLWAVAKVGAVTIAAARQNRHVVFMCRPASFNRDSECPPDRRGCSRPCRSGHETGAPEASSAHDNIAAV